jgi:hypothetical protein
LRREESRTDVGLYERLHTPHSYPQFFRRHEHHHGTSLHVPCRRALFKRLPERNANRLTHVLHTSPHRTAHPTRRRVRVRVHAHASPRLGRTGHRTWTCRARPRVTSSSSVRAEGTTRARRRHAPSQCACCYTSPAFRARVAGLPLPPAGVVLCPRQAAAPGSRYRSAILRRVGAGIGSEHGSESALLRRTRCRRKQARASRRPPCARACTVGDRAGAEGRELRSLSLLLGSESSVPSPMLRGLRGLIVSFGGREGVEADGSWRDVWAREQLASGQISSMGC